MIQTIGNWLDVIGAVKKENPRVNPVSYQYKHLITAEAESKHPDGRKKYNLSRDSVVNLATYLGIRLFSQPTGIPTTWPMSLCKKYLTQKYINPADITEWVVVKQADAWGGLPYVIHRTPHGFADARWFYEVAPQLYDIAKDPTLGIVFSGKFNETVNKKFISQNNFKGMTPGQIQTINLFFDKYVPSLEGLCSTCFKVSLPRSGAGERWVREEANGMIYEVRLSAAKPTGQKGQRIEYVSQTIIDQNQDKNYFALWDPIKSSFEYTNNMKQEYTHIPWSTYDYNKFNVNMPLCLCKGKYHEKKQFIKYY